MADGSYGQNAGTRLDSIVGYLVGFLAGFGIWFLVKDFRWSFSKPRGLAPSWSISGAIVFVIVSGILNLPIWVMALLGIAGFVAGDRFSRWNLAELMRKQNLKDSLLLPNLIDLLAISLTAGLSLKTALENAIPKTDVDLQHNWSPLIQTTNEASFAARLESVSRVLPGSASAKLADQLLISIERGTPLLPMLDVISADVRSTNYRVLHEKAAAKDVWMMLPVVFGILPAVTAIAIYPALTTLSNI